MKPGLLGSPWRNLLASSAFVLVVMAGAVVAYMACGWSFLDALYMVVITVYTVGYGEVHPIAGPALHAVTLALIVLGCTGMLLVTGAFVQLITANQFAAFLGSRRMSRDIDRLAGHVVICGYGRIGRQLARELQGAGQSFVVVERSPERFAAAQAAGQLALEGDATDESCLLAAGITRARALATVLPADSANVFITLSARSLNRELVIIARGEAPSTERKLLQAGASRVVMPTHIGAERIAELILYRDMSQRLAAESGDLERLGLEMEVVPVEPGSWSAGRTVGALEAEAAGAFLLIGLHRAGLADRIPPAADTVLEPGDGAALVGRPGRAETVSRLFTAR